MNNRYAIAACWIAACLTCSAQRLIVVDDDSKPSQFGKREAIQTTVLLQTSERKTLEVPDGSVFFDGQRFRLQISAGQSGYLYVLCENAQGSTTILNPNPLTYVPNHVRQ